MQVQRLLTVLLAVLCAGSAFGCGAARRGNVPTISGPARSVVVVHETLPCIQRHASRIRQTLARAEAIALFEACAPRFRQALGPLARKLDAAQFKAAFATAVANRYAPYGPSHALTIPQLRRATTMNCANYVAVVFWVYRHLGGPVNAARFMGFDHGAVGNHAQLWFGSMLSDPTTGLIALAPLDAVLAGRPATILVDVSGRPEDPPDFRAQVMTALEDGLYRPQDVIYARSPAQYLQTTKL